MPEEEEISDDEALMKIANAMKDNNIGVDGSKNVHTFLFNIAEADDTAKIANLRNDKELDELGRPEYPVRASKEMARISEMIMDNPFFAEYFRKDAEDTLATSLSREGFLVRQGTTQTKQVADVTKRKKINKGWFGKQKEEVTGGFPDDVR